MGLTPVMFYKLPGPNQLVHYRRDRQRFFMGVVEETSHHLKRRLQASHLSVEQNETVRGYPVGDRG